MSLEQVNQILGRALLDEGFRTQLLNNAEETLRGFDLTDQEIETLKGLNADQFQKLNEAFKTQLGGAEANATQVANFIKLDGANFMKIPSHFMKLESVESVDGTKATNAWPSKIVPRSNVATKGLSYPVILAIGSALVVTLGAVIAGIFFFRAEDNLDGMEMDAQPITQENPGLSQENGPVSQPLTLESDENSLCLTGENFHMCAIPADHVADQLGNTNDDPLMLPLTPEQAALLISASGGSPPGVRGFTMMMLAGPETYRIKLPDSSTGFEAVFLTDTQGNPYFGSGDFFSEKILSSSSETEKASGIDGVTLLAGNWEGLSAPGTMTCNGSSITTPAEPPAQVVFNGSGQGIIAQELVEDSILEIISSSDGTYLASVNTVVDGETVTGEFKFSLVSPDVIEGTYSATYSNGCSFERAVTMNRISSAETEIQENQAPLKPAEFSVENYFGLEDTFIPQFETCVVFPDVCKGEITASESINTLMDIWSTFDADIFMHVGGGGGAGKVNINNPCDNSDSSHIGTACVPSPDQGDAYIPPYPVDAGWDSKGMGNPTLVTVLDVDAISAINGIYDLWVVMGIPQTNEWGGIIDISSDFVQVYELDPNTGQQELWGETKFTSNTVDITTDQNRLFVFYLFNDEVAAKDAPKIYP